MHFCRTSTRGLHAITHMQFTCNCCTHNMHALIAHKIIAHKIIALAICTRLLHTQFACKCCMWFIQYSSKTIITHTWFFRIYMYLERKCTHGLGNMSHMLCRGKFTYICTRKFTRKWSSCNFHAILVLRCSTFHTTVVHEIYTLIYTCYLQTCVIS